MEQPTVRQAGEADFTFRVGSLPTEELKVTGFTGTEGISELFHFQIEFCSDERDIDFTGVVGQACVLEIANSAGSRYINGIVRRFARTGEGVNLTYYSAEVVPMHWLLTKRYKSRVFTVSNCADMTAPGIIKKVLEDAGIPNDAFRMALSGSYPARDYVAQYRETEMDFISRLAEHEGIFYFFEHSAEGHVMVFGDSPVAHVATPGDAEWPFHEPSGLVPDKEYVFSLQNSEQMRFGAVALDSFNFQQPQAQLRATTAGEDLTSLEWSEYPPIYVEKSDGDRYAGVRLEEYQASRKVVNMGTVIRALLPGYKFTLEGHASDSLNIEYLVTHISHRARQTQSTQEEADSTEGTKYESDVRCISAGVPFRPPRVTPRPIVQGSQTAIIVGPSGEEIYTDKYGRVRIQFHWDQEGEYNENSSFWVRVSQGWAGGNYGIMFLPRIGQEVIVDFLEGNPDFPIVIGRVYNNDHMPPYTLPAEKTKSVIKTNSSKDGKGNNEIRFEDLTGKEQLFIQAQRMMDTRVKASHMHTIGGSYHLDVGGEKDGKLFGEYRQLIYEAKHTHVKGERCTLIEKDDGLQVDGNVSIKVGGTLSTDVAKDVVDKFGAGHKHDVTMVYALKALGVKIEASTGIELKCGGTSIVLTPAAIFITGGPLVNINTGSGPPVTAPTAKATSPTKPEDPAIADKSDPGKDVSYGAEPAEYEPLEAAAAEGAPPVEETAEQEKKSWIKIRLKDEADRPVSGEKYRVTTADGSVKEGALNAEGRAHITNIAPGTCQICFPDLDLEAWERV